MNNPDGTSWPYAGSVDGAAAAAWNDVQRNGNMVSSTSFRFISTYSMSMNVLWRFRTSTDDPHCTTIVFTCTDGIESLIA